MPAPRAPSPAAQLPAQPARTSNLARTVLGVVALLVIAAIFSVWTQTAKRAAGQEGRQSLRYAYEESEADRLRLAESGESIFRHAAHDHGRVTMRASGPRSVNLIITVEHGPALFTQLFIADSNVVPNLRRVGFEKVCFTDYKSHARVYDLQRSEFVSGISPESLEEPARPRPLAPGTRSGFLPPAVIKTH